MPLKAPLDSSCNPSDRSEMRVMLLSRRTHFFILEKFFLPLVIFPFRLLCKTWRLKAADQKVFGQVAATAPLVMVTYHGMAFHILAYARFFPRRLVVMVSPSYDGRLLAAFLKYFGIERVSGSSKSCVAKPGFLKMASAASAHLILATTSASSGITFKTWDRAHLPAPFAALELSLQLLPPPDVTDPERELSAVQELLVSSARKIGSPVLQTDRYGTVP